MIASTLARSSAGRGDARLRAPDAAPYRGRWSRLARDLGAIAGAAGIALTLAACGDPAPAAAPGAIDRSALLPVPMPDIAGLPASEQTALAEGRAALDAAITDPGTPDSVLADRFGEQGQRYHAHGLLQAAEPCYANAADLDPATLDWPYYLGQVYRALGRPDDSVAAFEQALAIDADHVPSLYWLAAIHLEHDRVDDAAPLLEQAAAAAPSSAAVWIARARVTTARGEHQRSVEYLLEAKRLDPRASAADYPLGLAYRALGDTANAERYLTGGEGVAPVLEDPLMAALDALTGGAEVLVNRGVEAVGRGDLDAAEGLFREAIALDPDNVSAHLNLAVALAEHGRLEGAAEPLGTAVALDPDNARANFNMGSLLAKLRRDAEAVPFLEAAVRIDPNYKEAELNLGNALWRQGRGDEALPHYARVIALDPSHRDARRVQATILFNAGHWPEALAALEEAHTVLPDEAAFAALLARLLATCPDDGIRDGVRALALIDPVVKADPSPEHVRVRAMALAAAGRYAEAASQAQVLVTAARDAKREDVAREVESDLAAYRAGRPVLAR